MLGGGTEPEPEPDTSEGSLTQRDRHLQPGLHEGELDKNEEFSFMFTLRFFQVRLKTSQPFHGVIHARDSRDNACLTYGTSRIYLQ